MAIRNTVANDYEKINYDLVYKIIQKDIKDIESFMEIISKI